MYFQRLLFLWLLVSCSPMRPLFHDSPSPETFAVQLLTEIDRLSPEERLTIYGCEPEKWPKNMDDPREFLQSLLALGETEVSMAYRDSSIWRQAWIACQVLSPLACCQVDYLNANAAIAGHRGDTNLQRVAWVAATGYKTFCFYAPRGFRGIRGCINLVAISPIAKGYRSELNPELETPTPIPDEERLDVLRKALRAYQHGKIDEPASVSLKRFAL